MKKIIILKENEDPRPQGDEWRKKPPGHVIDNKKYIYSTPEGTWYRDKTAAERVRDGVEREIDNITNSGTSGVVYNDVKKQLKELKQWAKETASTITYQNVIDKFGNITDYIYEKGKGGLKKVGGDIKNLIDMIPETEENVKEMTLDQVMEKKIPLSKGSEGDNITELHDIIQNIGKTISEDEFNDFLFGETTETAIKELQKELGLPVTGILNKKTYDKLLNYQPPKEEPIQKIEREINYVYESVLINEAEELDTQQQFLNECKQLKCFENYISDWILNNEPKLEKQKLSDNTEIYMFVYKMIENPNAQICFGADNWIYQIITDNKGNEKRRNLNKRWYCGNKYCNTTQRLQYVQNLINNSPGTYEYTKTSDQSEKIDLSDETKKSANDQKIGNKAIFPKSGMCFIFRKSFEKGKEKDVIGQIETLLNKAGFSMDEPGVSDLQKISFPVGDILVLNNQQKEMFKEQLKRRAFPNQNSDFIKFIPKSTSLFKESCKNIFTKLYNGIHSPYDNFFYNQGQTQKYTSLMQYKIKAMMCEQTPKAMEFCLKNNDNRSICKLVRRTSNEYGIKDLIKSDSEQTNENFISKTIKEHLTRLSKQKKKSLLEKRIVENRFKVLVENKNPKRIKDVNKFVQEAYDEMTYLSNQKYETNLISESLFDMMKLFVGPTGEQSVKKTFKQYVTNNLIQKLTPNKPNGYLAKIIEKTISELDLRDAPKLTDCHFVSEILTQSILNQIMIQKQKSEHHIENPLDELVADSIFDSLYESNIHERLSSGISNYICPRLNQIQSNLDNKFIQSKNRIF